LTKLGSSWEWLDNGDLRTTTACLPAVKVDDAAPHRSNATAFFNSIVAAYKGWNDSRNTGERAILLGDGSQLNPRDIEHAAKVMDEIRVVFQWQAGDVLLIDNRLVM
jgi:hypothetical protein